MTNLLESVKRFLANKNTVTILGVIAGVLVLYIGYNWRVKQAVEPVTIPYSKEELSSRTYINDDVIGYMEVSGNLLKKSKNIIKSSSELKNKYVAYGVTIPVNSFFYKETIMSESDIPDSAFANIKDNYTIYSLPVSLHTTYGNSMCPGNYIDLYFKAVDDDRKVIFGKLIESIEILDVRDSDGNPVFETMSESRTPAMIYFAVPDEMYLLLMKAGYISNDVEIVPVPRNESYSNKEDDETTKISSEYIRSFILSKTATIPDEIIMGTNSTNINSSINSNNNNNNIGTNE